jgi:rhodanese-related sulfurtransferase
MTSTAPKTVAQLVTEAKSRIENLTPQQVSAEIAAGQAVLVDIREPEEAQQNGHIEGAVPAPRGMLEFWADPASPYHRPEFDPGKRVILYCASGGRSALSCSGLGELGYRRIAHLDGGLKAWKEAGLPLAQPNSVAN